MDRLRAFFLLTLVVLCVTTGAPSAHAQSFQCGTISSCPNASVPLAGGEFIPIVQSGVTKKTTISQLLAFNALPVVQVSADRTGVTSACPGVLAAQNAIQALPNGGTMLFPQGVFNMASCKITLSNRNVRVAGVGIGVTELLFTGTPNSGGISVSQSSFNFNTEIDHMSIETNITQSAASAISVTYPGGNELGVLGVFDTLDIGGVEGVESAYWGAGIYCARCAAGSIRDSSIQGAFDLVGGEMGSSTTLYGLHLVGDSSNEFLVDHTQFYNMQYAVYNDGDNESISFVNGSQAVGVNHGLYFPNGANYPGFHLFGSDYACYIDCIYIAGWQQGTISGNTIYKRPDSTQNFTAIVLANQGGSFSTFDSTIHDNVFIGFKGNAGTAGTAIAVSLDTAVAGVDVHDNVWTTSDFFLNGNTGTGVNYVHDNSWNGSPTPTAWVTNVNYNNVMFRNFPVITTDDLGYCPASGATLNISGGLVCNDFLVSQSGATNVTSLANGYPGQVAILAPTDNNTTYVQGAGLILAGETNYNAQAGDVSTFLYDTAAGWRETSRLAATTINGTKCWPGLSCSISATTGAITAGTTIVNGGPGVLQNAANGGTLISSFTLPSGLTAPNFSVVNSSGTGIYTTDFAQDLTQGTSKTAAAIYAPLYPGGYHFAGINRAVLDLESGTMVQGAAVFDAYIYNHVAQGTAPNQANAVGLAVNSVNAVAGAFTWGMNPACNDGGFASTCIGSEADFTQTVNGDTFIGYNAIIQGAFTPSGAIAFATGHVGSGAQWSYGLFTADGDAAVGMRLGALSASATTNGPSQPALFYAYDSGSTEYHMEIEAIAHTMNFLDSVNACGIGLQSGSTSAEVVPSCSGGNLVLVGNGSGAVFSNSELLTRASTTGSSGFNLPQGAAPTSPVNGDVWMTSAGLFYRANGTTTFVGASTTYTAAAGLTLTGTAFSLGDGVGISYVSPGQLSLIGGTITTNLSQLNTTVTWNASGVTFDAPWKLNVTNTNSAIGSLLVDMQVNSVSEFSVSKAGLIGLPAGGGLSIGSTTSFGPNAVTTGSSSYFQFYLRTYFSSPTDSAFLISNNAGTQQVILSTPALSTLHFGNIDAASVVAQTTGVQGIVTGTSNTPGANWTFTGSAGTGTGVGGDIIFKVAKAGSTGSTQNSETEGFRIAAATALPQWPSSTTGAGTATFTNAPCTGLTTEQWLPVQITGQSGTWYLGACQ